MGLFSSKSAPAASPISRPWSSTGRLCCFREATRLSSDLPIEQLLSTADASSHAGVSVAAIRKWVQRGHLDVAMRDGRGRPLFRWIDVAKAEYATRMHANRKYPHRSFAA